MRLRPGWLRSRPRRRPAQSRARPHARWPLRLPPRHPLPWVPGDRSVPLLPPADASPPATQSSGRRARPPTRPSSRAWPRSRARSGRSYGRPVRGVKEGPGAGQAGCNVRCRPAVTPPAVWLLYLVIATFLGAVGLAAPTEQFVTLSFLFVLVYNGARLHVQEGLGLWVAAGAAACCCVKPQRACVLP